MTGTTSSTPTIQRTGAPERRSTPPAPERLVGEVPTTVLIVDDHALFREGLEALMDRWPDFRVVATAGSGDEGVQLAAELCPDLILMDVRMAGMDGIEATRRICAHDHAPRVVMLTVSGLAEDLFQALRCGAWGFLGKDEPADQLHASLQGVMRGETALSSAAARMMLNELGCRRRHTGGPVSETLTSRETDVLRLLVDGMSNEEIAAHLHISLATVKKHLGNVMTKLHLKNRVQVAVRALRDGIVG